MSAHGIKLFTCSTQFLCCYARIMILCINKNSYFVFLSFCFVQQHTMCWCSLCVFPLDWLAFFRRSVSLRYSFLVLSLRWNAICYAACRLSMFSFNLDILQGKIKQEKNTHIGKFKWNGIPTHTHTINTFSHVSIKRSTIPFFVLCS